MTVEIHLALPGNGLQVISERASGQVGRPIRTGSDATMPRYFFHTHIGDEVITDPAGTDLRDADHAWAVARDTVRATMSEKGTQTRLMGASLVVTDASGETVLEFPFAELATVAPEDVPTLH